MIKYTYNKHVGENMYFVYTSWYIVMAILLLGIIALVVTYIMMDKKDRLIIQQFKEENSVEPEPEHTEVTTEKTPEEKLTKSTSTRARKTKK